VSGRIPAGVAGLCCPMPRTRFAALIDGLVPGEKVGSARAGLIGLIAAGRVDMERAG